MLLALGAIVAMVIARSATERVVSEVPDVVVRPGAKAAATSIVGDLGSSLLRTLGVVLVLATLVAAGTVLIRRWRRRDLIIVASVLAGVLFLGILGLTIVSMLLAVAVAAGVAIVTTRFWPDTATA